MKTKKILILFLSLGVIGISSCTKKSEKLIDGFFESFNNKDFSEIGNLAYEDKSEMLEALTESLYESLGEVESYEKYSFNTNIDGGTKVVELYYKLEVEKEDKTVYMKFDVIDEKGKDLKIKAIVYSTNKKFIDNYNDNKVKALETVEEYYEYLEDDDDESIYDMLSDDIINEEATVNMFFEFIVSRRDYYGRIEELNYSHSRSEFYDGKAHFSVYYICESDSGKEFIEEISVVEEGNEFKIFNYRYAHNFQELEEL